MQEILLPNWEIMQGELRISASNSFGLLEKQKWEAYGYQNGTELADLPTRSRFVSGFSDCFEEL